jgi:Protein of unknown function (DUF732)
VNKALRMVASIAGAGALTMLTVPAFAHANSPDSQFLAAVSSQGINGQPDQLIAFAHSMCDVVGTFAAVGPQYGLMASQGLSPQQVFYVATDGVRAYCPEKTPAFPPMLMPPA